MEISSFNEHLTSPPRHGTSNKLLIVSVIIAVLLSVIAMIVALVSVGKIAPTNVTISSPANIGSSGRNVVDDDDAKIWLFAFGDFGGTYFDDATGELKGFSVDVANAVCTIANKNCQTVYDTRQRCWDSQAGSRSHAGEGIMAGYYDACMEWAHTYGRHSTLRFSSPYIRKSLGGFITLAENADSFNWLNLTGNTIGFVDGSLFDEHCVTRLDSIQGNVLSLDQIRHYASSKVMYAALNDGEIDAAFYSTRYVGDDYRVVADGISECLIAGASVMTRRDNRLVDWWNPAFEKLKSTSQWRDICNGVTEVHGYPGIPEEGICVI